LPDGFIPTREGKAILFQDDADILPMLAFLNCGSAGAFVRDTCGLHKQSGAIGNVPVPWLDEVTQNKLRDLSREILVRSFRSFSNEETSRNFLFPHFCKKASIKSENESFIINLTKEIERITQSLFELGPDEKFWLEGAALPALYEPSPDDVNSWCIGVAFGRFDWRLATGEREAPPEADPFDPPPAISPGMLPDGAAPFHANPGILVDDPGHKHDLARLVEMVLERVEMPVPLEVRRWLQREFFPYHLQRYSKSRRKAPIYWPLATASGSYTLWLYYPALTSQTLYTAVNDFVEPKLDGVAKAVQALRGKTGRSRAEEKQMEELQDLEVEIRNLRDTLLRLAPTCKPNHDDGVQVTAAPLWPLFRHRPWQTLLKETWQKLERGDYDWAHLAMSYWPDRVREKCKHDKSLAIAHDLENLYEEPAPAEGAALRRGRRKKP
jgi:hypothetical protein